MKVAAIKTKKILPGQNTTLLEILDRCVRQMRERSILAITSKIVSICEGRVVKISPGVDKEKLIRREAEWYLPPETNRYRIALTMKRGLLIPTAGIDESNTYGYYALWPRNPAKTARDVRQYLKKRFKLRSIGVIITDSRTHPLRRGVLGVALAWSGFRPLNDYIGKPDLFGRKLKVTTVNVADGLAITTALAMGEGREQTPLAVIEDVPFVTFTDRDSPRGTRELAIDQKTDLYGPLLKGVRWKKGRGK